MTKGQLLEFLKGVPDNATILIYDQYEDISEDERLTDWSGNPIDKNHNPVVVDPTRYLRYPDKILPASEFSKELEVMGESEETVILRLS